MIEVANVDLAFTAPQQPLVLLDVRSDVHKVHGVVLLIQFTIRMNYMVLLKGAINVLLMYMK